MDSDWDEIDANDAIAPGNMAALGALLQSLSNPREDDLRDALNNTGDMAIIRRIMDEWPSDVPKKLSRDVLGNITNWPCNNKKKVQILQYLLPHIHPKHSTIPGFPTMKTVFNAILCCCSAQKFVLVEFFINAVYIEQHNSLYPLIKKLEATIDDWHYIGVLLHDDLNHLDCDYARYSVYGRIHFNNAGDTFIKLLMKDTRESLELAIEIFQVFLDKKYHKLIPYYFKRFLFFNNVEAVLEDPLKTKLLFQFFYTAMNGKAQAKIYESIDLWLLIGQQTHIQELYQLSLQLLNPFISKPLREKPQNDDPQAVSEQDGVLSLKELSRDVIRCKVFQSETNTKKFMDRIWEMKLPVTLKCFLLYIPDSAWSWMNDLQMA